MCEPDPRDLDFDLFAIDVLLGFTDLIAAHPGLAAPIGTASGSLSPHSFQTLARIVTGLGVWEKGLEEPGSGPDMTMPVQGARRARPRREAGS
jgi:hypothetical protein